MDGFQYYNRQILTLGGSVKNQFLAMIFGIAGLVILAGGCGSKNSPTSAQTDTAPKALSAFATIGSGTYFSTELGVLSYVNGKLWVVDDTSSSTLSEWATNGSAPLASIDNFNGGVSFDYAWGDGIDPATGNVYVGDQDGGNVEVFDSTGTYLTSVNSDAITSSGPAGVAINSAGTTLYVLNYYAYTVNAFPITPGSPPTFGTPVTFSNSGSAALSDPYNIRLDHSGNVWVTDYSNARLAEFNAAGTYLKQISPNIAGFKPTDLAFGATGDIYVTDAGNNQIVEMDPSGSAFTEVGNSFLNSPEGIATDGNGTYYVTDAGNSQVVAFH
jgi:sugar lactone lactonase YvrE